MFMRLAFLVLVIAFSALNSGCSTLADARAGKGTGTARVFDASADAVWTEMPAVVKDVGLDLAGENRQQGYLLAQRGITPFSYGENVAIFIDEVAKTSRTRVEIVSKKAMATNVFAPDWGDEILDKLAKKLKPTGTPGIAAVTTPERLPGSERKAGCSTGYDRK